MYHPNYVCSVEYRQNISKIKKGFLKLLILPFQKGFVFFIEENALHLILQLVYLSFSPFCIAENITFLN